MDRRRAHRLLRTARTNRYHDKRQAQFYLFECEEDFEVATACSTVVRGRSGAGCTRSSDPRIRRARCYGMLVDGFEFRTRR